MLSIGELSRISQLTVKALRLYHRKGILIPDKIDFDSSYRYYKSDAVPKALMIKTLRKLDFSLKEIKQIMLECTTEKQISVYLKEKIKEIDERINDYKNIRSSLSAFIKEKRRSLPGFSSKIELIRVPDSYIASIRFKGTYPEVGQHFGTLFRKCGANVRNKPFSLYYDNCYKEENADIEACVELKKQMKIPGIRCRRLKGGNGVAIIHRGPYTELGRTYQKIYEYCRSRRLKILSPIREEYIRGPGMFARGDPKKYITRIIFMKQ